MQVPVRWNFPVFILVLVMVARTPLLEARARSHSTTGHASGSVTFHRGMIILVPSLQMNAAILLTARAWDGHGVNSNSESVSPKCYALSELEGYAFDYFEGVEWATMKVSEPFQKLCYEGL